MKNPETVLVPCSISSGMFPDEYAVEIKLKSGKVLSLFVESSDLENIDIENNRAELRAKLLGDEEVTGEVLMYLPKESLETGNHLLKLPREQVKQLA